MSFRRVEGKIYRRQQQKSEILTGDFIISKIPMQRYDATEEAANLALFLAGGESTFRTGGIQMIDGGFIAA